MWWLDRLAVELLAPLAVWVLASGLDDLFLDLCYGWLRLRGRRRGRRTGPAQPAPPRIAILVPCWREAAVIGAMLERNLAEIEYDNYDFWVGLYPNDPASIDEVHRYVHRFQRVHGVVGPRNGPTTKADCVNRIFAAIFRYEASFGARYDIFLQHDAEDLIHPHSLSEVARASATSDMIQTPVFPLASRLTELTHGVYGDEFAESHQRDLPVRARLGGFIPSAGVGTALTRNAVDQLRIVAGDHIFDSDSLTEDYFLGLQVKLLGFRQAFLDPGGDRFPMATRAYFPRTAGAAIRQRTRWIIGNHLQAWERFGWRGGPMQRYWLWRDRKSLINHPLSALATLLFLYGLGRALWAKYTGDPWALGQAISAQPWLPAVLVFNLVLLIWRMLVRGWLGSRLYGWIHGLLIIVRAPWANAINFLASANALWVYARARRLRRPLTWSKTEHRYPAATSARAAGG